MIMSTSSSLATYSVLYTLAIANRLVKLQGDFLCGCGIWIQISTGNSMICKTILYVSSCVYGETGMLALLRITNFCLELEAVILPISRWLYGCIWLLFCCFSDWIFRIVKLQKLSFVFGVILVYISCSRVLFVHFTSLKEEKSCTWTFIMCLTLNQDVMDDHNKWCSWCMWHDCLQQMLVRVLNYELVCASLLVIGAGAINFVGDRCFSWSIWCFW